jgi:hypothetical protein
VRNLTCVAASALTRQRLSLSNSGRYAKLDCIGLLAPMPR